MRPRHESAFQKRHGNDDPASKITNTKQAGGLSTARVRFAHVAGVQACNLLYISNCKFIQPLPSFPAL